NSAQSLPGLRRRQPRNLEAGLDYPTGSRALHIGILREHAPHELVIALGVGCDNHQYKVRLSRHVRLTRTSASPRQTGTESTPSHNRMGKSRGRQEAANLLHREIDLQIDCALPQLRR